MLSPLSRWGSFLILLSAAAILSFVLAHAVWPLTLPATLGRRDPFPNSGDQLRPWRRLLGARDADAADLLDAERAITS